MKCSPPTGGANEPQTSTLTNISRNTPISPPRRRIGNAFAQLTANVQNPIHANSGSQGTMTRTRLTTTLNRDRRTSIRLKKRSTRASIGSHQKSIRVQKGSRSTNNRSHCTRFTPKSSSISRPGVAHISAFGSVYGAIASPPLLADFNAASRILWVFRATSGQKLSRRPLFTSSAKLRNRAVS